MMRTEKSEILAQIRRSGFPYPDDLAHVFVGGSELHGAKVHGTDDLDIYGVYIEPAECALGLLPLDHYVWSTSGDERRNGPDDVDVTLYSLRKWANLAYQGNPTALHFLFSPPLLAGVWTEVVRNKRVFLARSAARQFTGFADNQLKRLTGKLGRGKKGQRPEIEEKYGFDTKAAMHTLRLLFECKELLEQANITLPRPEKDLLIRVRTGEVPRERVLQMAETLFLQIEDAEKNSLLPERVDRGAISRLVAGAYQAHWADCREA